MAAKSEVSQALHYGCALAAITVAIVFWLTDYGQVKQKTRKFQTHRRPLAVCISFVVLSYVVEGIATAAQDQAYLHSQPHLIHIIILAFIWCKIGIRSIHVLYEILGTSLATSAFEMLLLVFFPYQKLGGSINTIQLVCQIARALGLLILLFQTCYSCLNDKQAHGLESQPILSNESNGTIITRSTYGSEDAAAHPDLEDTTSEENEESSSDCDSESDERIKRRRAQRLKETGGWWGYLKDFSILLPYLIPRGDLKVQFSYVVTVLCLSAHRAFNIIIPLQLGAVVEELSEKRIPYRPLAVWLLLSLLSEDSGVGLVENLARISINQFSYRKIANAAFGHVMNLGMDFHSERDSAEVMKAVEQGEALNTVLETAVTDILPTILDLTIAVILLYSKFNVYVSLTMVIAAVTYLSLEVSTANWNTGNRRRLTKAERDQVKAMHQAVQGWQTVYYFNMFSYERNRFGSAVEKNLQADIAWNKRRAYIDALLHLFVPTTFACISFLVFLEISHGRATTGDFVFLIQYWDNLVWPLTFLSKQYRWLLADLIDAERLLDLLKTKPTIVDHDTAKDLEPVKGHVAFEQVSFSYDSRKPIIEDVDFSALPGETIALVGETGAGKSTIIKLLLRFYDITSGHIKIDGQDIRDVTLDSLRNALGIVPQDPLLFNASIAENLRYGRPSATHAELEAACQSAAIHKKILTFPDGYDTVVGENGVKLSGGEIQRLAIARVFLKDPPILILDEATSAVDTAIESEIQSVLAGLRKTRTTFVIAHRLSTIVGADRILVMHEGRIVERGTHRNLLKQGGRYKELWTKQVEGVMERKKSISSVLDEVTKVDPPDDLL